MFKFKKKNSNENLNEEESKINEENIEETKTEIKKEDLFIQTKNNEIKEDKVLDQSIEMKSPEEIKQGEKEEKREENKEKVKTGFNKYKFIIEIVSLVILIAFAIFLFVERDRSIFILLMVTGGIVIIASLFNLFGLIKTEYEEIVKKISLVIGLVNLGVGAYLIVCSIIYVNCYENSNYQGLIDYIDHSYQYFLVGSLASYSILYLWKTCLHNAKASKFMFWLHIFFMVAASVILAFTSNGDKEFTISRIVVVIGVACAICALILLIDAIIGYHNYNSGQNRKEKVSLKKEEIKEETKKEDVILDKDDNDANISQDIIN